MNELMLYRTTSGWWKWVRLAYGVVEDQSEGRWATPAEAAQDAACAWPNLPIWVQEDRA